MNNKRTAIALVLCQSLLISLAGIASAQQKKEAVTGVTVKSGPVKSVETRVYMTPGELMGGWNNSDKTVTNRLDYVVEDGELRGYLKIAGTSGVGKWNYAGSQHFVFLPGKKYRMSGWMLVESISDLAWPPYLKCTLLQNEKWINNFMSRKYDLSRKDEWQFLSVEFSVPEGEGYKGNIAVEKGTKDSSLSIKAELSDLEIEIIE